MPTLVKGEFHYETAFSRSVGFLTVAELALLRTKKVAIAGMGGVGGAHLLTLTRLGIGSFHTADFDIFEIHNFNRQAGAYMDNIGKPKLDVMTKMAKQINPELQINEFHDGVTSANLEAFFRGVDVYVDGLDFFAFAARKMVFDYCYNHQIPIVTAGPIGMGAALLNFIPGQMSPSEYFNWQKEDSDEVLGMKFLLGLTPSMSHRNQMVVPGAINLAEHRGPSTPMACEICAGVAGTEVMKILIQRGPVKAAPYSIHFDAFENRLHLKKIWFGNRNPLQQLKISLGLKQLRKAKPVNSALPQSDKIKKGA